VRAFFFKTGSHLFAGPSQRDAFVELIDVTTDQCNRLTIRI
jgi:hypothetical protein